MRFNFKKIAAIGASVLLAGMTTGFAAAAAFPAPFVQGGAANVAIVYGTGAGVSPLDVVQAGNIQTALASSVGTASSSSTIVSSGGDLASLDTSGQRIWLNSSLTVKQILTANDMPTLLAITNFNGNLNVQVTPNIITSGGLATATSNNKIVFAKLGTADPQVGVSMGVTPVATNALYNATVTFSSPVNFTDPNSQGQVLTLFGNQYTVASTTSASNGLVLFGSAQTVTLTQGSSGSVPTATVNVNGATHTVTLTNVGSNTAYVSVDGSGAQSINSGSSRLINGVNIAVTSVASSTAGGNSATVLVGANQLTLVSGQAVQVGTNNNVIQGTYVDFNGATVGNLTKLTIAVAAPSVSNNLITANKSFVDPVFGTFLVGFAGLSPQAVYASNTGIQVGISGSSTMNLAFTDYKNNSISQAFAYNASGTYNLSDGNGYQILPYESANVTLNGYTMVGNQNHAHFLQLLNVVNGTTAANSYATFYDFQTGKQINTQTGTLNSGNLYLDGYSYSVTFGNMPTSSVQWATVKFSTGDSGNANTFSLYPSIQTSKGVQLEFYTPLNVSLSSFGGSGNLVSTLQVPNGNGWSQITVAFNAGTGNWTIGGTAFNTSSLGSTAAAPLVVTPSGSKLSYVFTPGVSASGAANVGNYTVVSLVQPGTAATAITTPSIVEIEGKDSNSNYNAIVVPTQLPSTAVGVSTTPYFTSALYQSGALVLSSNNKLTQFMDGYGALVTVDSSTSGQPIATINNPAQQSYSQIYVSQASATIGGNSTGQLGNVLVKDSAVSSVASDNLIVVGGSCINSAAATLVGGAYCGDAWTSATGVGTGQFLIQSYNSTAAPGMVALLVAGFDASDTVNAATYLTMQKPDTALGKKYIGTTSTSAQLQVSQ